MSQISTAIHTQVSRISAVRERQFYLLFLFLLAYLILYPYIQNRGFEYLAFRAFGVSVTLLSVYAVSFRRCFVFVALVLAIPTLVQRLLLPRGDEGTLALLSIIFSFAFDLFIVVVIFRRVFAKHVPNAETIFGTLYLPSPGFQLCQPLSPAGHGAAKSLLSRSGLEPPPGSESF
jgi:hypothetical protein